MTNDWTVVGTLNNEPSTRDLSRHNVEMNAEQLYAVWLEAMKKQGIEADVWDDLLTCDRVAWEAVADAKDSPHGGGKL